MDTTLKTSIWQQFGASIDMLDNAISACPDQLWLSSLWNDPNEEPEYSQFWFLAYHTLFWLDLYLSGSSEDFTPPAPFIRGSLPEKPYTKDALRVYLQHGRRKCQATIEALSDEKARQRCHFDWGEVTFLELLLYNMRHVQEHGAQLRMLLGQNDISVNDWVTIAENKAA
jgi:hypothetical protein